MNEPAGVAVLETEDLAKGYPSGRGRLEVLRGVSMNVRRAEVVAVVGPSGSGKSTLLHCVGGLDRPDSGRVRVSGIDLQRLKNGELARVRNRQIGFVFQFHHLLPDFTALENVMLPALIAGSSQREAAARARELLSAVGIAERETHAPAELSGGEQQRVAVARALANAPAAVLADEPSGNLDTHTAADLHRLLFRLRDERGVTFLIATHDPSLARQADRILVIRDGSLYSVEPATWSEEAQLPLQGVER
ncbi:MAG TPA: ABC transporter ATP-binding protein [bacterium]|nr:ABC transporter ATP-binding protein [bacterium]